MKGHEYTQATKTRRRGGRAAEGNGLLNRRRLTPYRGFKSRPLRHFMSESTQIFPETRSAASH